MSVELIDNIDRLKRINSALMKRVESSMDQQGNAFSLFQTAINLEGQVKRRTDELTTTMRRLEMSNSDLEAAKDASEQANLSKTRFLAAASHDILQPLNAALLSLSVLADIQQSETGKRLAGQIEHSLETMNELLKTLLDISKLDAGIILPRLEPLSLPLLIDDLSLDFAPMADAKGLDFDTETKDITVLSDRTMLRRILQNLISNAIRYTNAGSVAVYGKLSNDGAVITITDTGPGIAEAHHEQVFEEFHRGSLPVGHERDANSGLGLGLSIVKRMAAALNHPLKLISQKKEGTTFQLELPLSMTPAFDDALSRPGNMPNFGNLTGVKLLLIENDPAGCQASLTLFDSWHCDSRLANSIPESLDQISSTVWQPDLIIADLHLDHGDLGTIAVQKIRDHIGHLVPAIIITADPTKTAEQQVIDSGMVLLLKPIKPAQLRALISHLISPPVTIG